MSKLEEKIAAAEAKVKQLKVRQRQIDARKRSLAARNERGKDLRRNILVGAIVLERVKAGEISTDDLHRWIEPNIARADDRALFDLPAKAEGASAN
ncbi:MAG: mobilization protein [Steroidobacteraceae bacterium]